MEARFALDFREQYQPQSLQFAGSSRSTPCWQVVEGGLRFTIPDRSEINYYAVSPRIVVKGDFEITAGFTILHLPQPNEGFGAGLRIAIEDPQGERAALQRLHREREGHVCASYRARRKEDDTYDHSVRMSPVSEPGAMSGRLRLRREGSKIKYQVAEADSEQFLQIHEEEFPADDVADIRLAVQTGGASTAVDVVWTHLDVCAEELVRTYLPPERPKIWRVLTAGCLALLVLAGICLAVWAWVARRAQLRPAQPVAPPKAT